MSRFTYSTSTPIGQIIAEAVNSAQESRYKFNRAAEAVTKMSKQEGIDELGIDNLTGFKSALNQINLAYVNDPFESLLPLLDQG